MNHVSRSLFLATAVTASLSAQSVLSDFTGPSPDGWTGVINGVTAFPNGSTAASGVTAAGDDVLNLSDGGFGGGAVRIYSGLPASGFVTISAKARIVTDPGTLQPDPNSNPGTFGTSFGLAAGSVGLADQDFGYGRSLSTAADDSGQSFMHYAATVRADGSGDFTAFFTPDQQDHALGLGGWVVQIDDVTHEDCFGAPVTLSDFASGTDGWASISPTTAPFGSGFTAVSQAGGELVMTDGGFAGGAYNTYVGAAPSAGVHTILVDVRIVTDSGSVDRARIAAAVGGVTTDYSALSFSQSFATAGDDSGQATQTVAVPVIAGGPSDITLYVLSDYDASVGGGSWEIHIDNVRVASPTSATTSLSSACGPGHHSLGGPVLSFPGVPTLGANFVIDGSNTANVLSVLFVGAEVAPVSLVPFGSIAGSQACINPIGTLTAVAGPSVSVSILIPSNAALCGQALSTQWADLDLSQPFALPLGTSRAGTFRVGL